MSEQNDPIQAAIAKANEAAKAQQSLPPNSNVPATASGGTVTVAAPAPAPVSLSMETMTVGSMSVDTWIKVKEDGLKIGEMAGLLESFEAVIDMTPGVGFVLKYGIKAGNPAQYAYTTDMANAIGGGTWPSAVARIQALDPSKPTAPYRCVDLPFTLISDVKKGDQVVGKAGDVVGYTTSTTNWKNWEEFYRDCSNQGLLNKKVKVKLTAQPRSNKAGNTWGVLKIEALSEYEEDASE